LNAEDPTSTNEEIHPRILEAPENQSSRAIKAIHNLSERARE